MLPTDRRVLAAPTGLTPVISTRRGPTCVDQDNQTDRAEAHCKTQASAEVNDRRHLGCVWGARLVALAITAGLVAFGPPVSAETETRDDRSGDAPDRIDIEQVDYSYDDGRVRANASIPDLGRAGHADLTITRFSTFEAGYVLRIAKKAGDPAKVRLYYFDHFSLNRRRCDDLDRKWRGDGLAISVPTDCLDGHARRTIRTQLSTAAAQEYDRAPAVGRLARN